MQLLIVEDHPFVAQSLGAALTAATELRSFDHALNVDAALAHLRANPHYSLIVLDLQLQGSSGLDALELMREHYSHIPVLVYSADGSRKSIIRVYEQGARGYVHKSAQPREIIGAIEIVLRGENYISSEAARVLGPEFSRTEIAGDTIRRLSRRQAQILRLLLRGETNKSIAESLGVATGTVKAHGNTIYMMFDVRNRAELVARAAALGIYGLLSTTS